MNAVNPVLVEVTRGDSIESRHRGACAVVDASGAVVQAWGDVERTVYARSAIKPIQALPLIESGAADRFGLSETDIALACASHSGEPEQTVTVERLLRRIGLGPLDLECGSHRPTDAATNEALIKADLVPSPLHNNCSGKHAGFLATAVHLNEPTAGYIQAGHPVQRRVTAALGAMGDFDTETAPRGTDGCGIPVIGMPLSSLARAMARLAAPDGLEPARAEACRRIVGAMTTHPGMVAGRGRFDTIAMTAGRGTFATKTGAEGIYAAILPEKGLGIALKIDDGATRAAEVAMANLLDRLGVLDDAARYGMNGFFEVSLRNWSGKRVGLVRPAPGWPG